MRDLRGAVLRAVHETMSATQGNPTSGQLADAVLRVAEPPIRTDEREQIAQAIEAQADDQYTEIGLTDYRDDRTWQKSADLSMVAGLRIAARIARNGGDP